MALALLAIVLSIVTMNHPRLPKPTPNCPDCRDAILANVKD